MKQKNSAVEENVKEKFLVLNEQSSMHLQDRIWITKMLKFKTNFTILSTVNNLKSIENIFL